MTFDDTPHIVLTFRGITCRVNLKMPAPKNPNTGPATDARKLQPGEMSEKYRIRGSTELHTWLASLTPSQIGELLSDIRGGVYGPYKRFG
jgi:hypothetical protein